MIADCPDFGAARPGPIHSVEASRLTRLALRARRRTSRGHGKSRSLTPWSITPFARVSRAISAMSQSSSLITQTRISAPALGSSAHLLDSQAGSDVQARRSERPSSTNRPLSPSEETRLGQRYVQCRRQRAALVLQCPIALAELELIAEEQQERWDRFESDSSSHFAVEPTDSSAEAFNRWRDELLRLAAEARPLWQLLSSTPAPRASARRRAQRLLNDNRQLVEQQLDRYELCEPMAERVLDATRKWSQERHTDAPERFMAALVGQQLAALEQELRDIRTQFIEANQGLVGLISRRYAGMGLSLADLKQEGNVGLMRAVEKFDFQRGIRFNTYASWWVRQSVRRALSNQSRTIRIPVHKLDTKYALDRATKRLTASLGRAPSRAELQAETGLSHAEMDRVGDLAKEPLSLESPRGEGDEGRLMDFVADSGAVDPGIQALKTEREQQLALLLEELTPRERQMFHMRFGLDGNDECTLEQVGQAFGLTRERIRQIIDGGMDKLRRLAARRNLDLGPLGG